MSERSRKIEECAVALEQCFPENDDDSWPEVVALRAALALPVPSPESHQTMKDYGAAPPSAPLSTFTPAIPVKHGRNDQYQITQRPPDPPPLRVLHTGSAEACPFCERPDDFPRHQHHSAKEPCSATAPVSAPDPAIPKVAPRVEPAPELGPICTRCRGKGLLEVPLVGDGRYALCPACGGRGRLP